AAGIGQFAVIQAAGSSLGVELRPINAADRTEIERSVTAFARSANGGLIVVPGRTGRIRDLIVSLAARHRLPAVYPYRYYVTEGGLISYAVICFKNKHCAASYVDRIPQS